METVKIDKGTVELDVLNLDMSIGIPNAPILTYNPDAKKNKGSHINFSKTAVELLTLNTSPKAQTRNAKNEMYMRIMHNKKNELDKNMYIGVFDKMVPNSIKLSLRDRAATLNISAVISDIRLPGTGVCKWVLKPAEIEGMDEDLFIAEPLSGGQVKEKRKYKKRNADEKAD